MPAVQDGLGDEPNGSDSGIYYDGAGWPEVHALGLQSDGKIIAAGVMQGVRVGTNLTNFGTGPAQATHYGPPRDNGTTEIQRFVLTPAMQDASSLFWRLAVDR